MKPTETQNNCGDLKIAYIQHLDHNLSHKGLQANAQSEQFSHATQKQHKTADSAVC